MFDFTKRIPKDYDICSKVLAEVVLSQIPVCKAMCPHGEISVSVPNIKQFFVPVNEH